MSVKNRNSIVTDGLVFYVDAGNGDSYPGSGTTWSDLVGSNNGTLTNGPTYSSDNGGSIVFDGANDYVEAGPIQPAQFTLSCWFKATGAPSNNDSNGGCLMASDPQLAGTLPWFMSHSYLNQAFALYVETTSDPLRTASNSVANNQVHLATATYDGTTGSIYLNGQFLDSKSFNTPTYNTSGNNNVQIGRWGYSSFQRHLNGNIYNASIYNRALSASEVLQNYNALKNRFI
jgi:hypothetical protein